MALRRRVAREVAGRVDQGGIDAVVRDVQGYARRNPGKFLLGALVAGFVVGRVVQHSDTEALKQAMRDGIGEAGDADGPAELVASPPSAQLVDHPTGHEAAS